MWRLQLLDHEYDGEWSWRKIDEATTMKIVKFLCEMERLTWQQIWDQRAHSKHRDGPKHKSIPVDSIVKAAQDRLTELNLDDHDELFRFRLGNMERLWGLLLNEGGARIFYPIWWDPDHLICP